MREEKGEREEERKRDWRGRERERERERENRRLKYLGKVGEISFSSQESQISEI